MECPSRYPERSFQPCEGSLATVFPGFGANSCTRIANIFCPVLARWRAPGIHVEFQRAEAIAHGRQEGKLVEAGTFARCPFVWAKTLEAYNEMVAAEGWSTRNTVGIPTVQTFTTKVCPPHPPYTTLALYPFFPTHPITVQEAVRVLANSHIVALLMPRWVQYLPIPGFSKICRATEAFTGFMKREIAARSEWEQCTDTFTRLVRENEQETGKLNSSDQEVIGNVFIILFAEHGISSKTTAHTLSATFALLALHQEIQDEIPEHILSVIGYDRDPIFSDYADLNKVLATFYEALRLFPSAYLMLREATKDTTEPPKSNWAGLMHAFDDA
ncbi:hypothetical protein DXG01_005223 [Tephrocybe rancida]|nr:hypothetical protein DXG01_005223 [Tephrocybe rancida]